MNHRNLEEKVFAPIFQLTCIARFCFEKSCMQNVASKLCMLRFSFLDDTVSLYSPVALDKQK